MSLPRTLLALQECDLEIARARKELDELPEKREILEARRKIAEVQGLRARAEEVAHRLESSISVNTDEVAGIDEKIADVQTALDSGRVTNPREVHNLSREMDALRRRKDKLEVDTLGLMERVEKATQQTATIDAALQALATREREATARFQKKGTALQEDVALRDARRKTLAAELGARLLSQYEGAAGSKGGIGAARLLDAACSACRMELPAERVQELRAGPEIGICPNCRRLLVVRGLADEAE
ncbi:MAG TPA: C4-type zinc ribbon domain-containing protein [Coriobacteriia bacterium]|nr:C4-type zinc ribbon domain-containing protein [Coriobacteriia bacterium]